MLDWSPIFLSSHFLFFVFFSVLGLIFSNLASKPSIDFQFLLLYSTSSSCFWNIPPKSPITFLFSHLFYNVNTITSWKCLLLLVSFRFIQISFCLLLLLLLTLNAFFKVRNQSRLLCPERNPPSGGRAASPLEWLVSWVAWGSGKRTPFTLLLSSRCCGGSQARASQRGSLCLQPDGGRDTAWVSG